jgi:hypothetical protein
MRRRFHPGEAGEVVLRRESHDMAVFRIALTEDERRVVNAERDAHPQAHVRRKMLVVWLLHCGSEGQGTCPTEAHSFPQSVSESVHESARTSDLKGQFQTIADMKQEISKNETNDRGLDETPGFVNENAPLTTPVISGATSGPRDLNPRPLAPQATSDASKSP